MANHKQLTSSSKSWVILIFLAVVWGSSFILIKKSLIAFAPEQVACFRITISALAFLPIFLIRFKEIKPQEWKYLIIVGLTGSGIPAFLYATAQTEVNSSVAGILNSLTPLWTLVLGIFLFKQKAILARIIGVMIGLMGAGLLILFGEQATVGGNPWYGLFIVLATLCYGTSANTVKTYLQTTHPLTLSAGSFLIIGPPALIYLGFTDVLTVFETHPDVWLSFGSVTILALVGTVMASILFFHLVQLTNAVFGSSVSYLIPIVALVFAAADGEVLTYLHFLGMLLILLGVYLSRNR
ncbi:MAG: DMT family transporter [Bacteroidota bacterium]